MIRTEHYYFFIPSNLHYSVLINIHRLMSLNDVELHFNSRKRENTH